MPPVHIPEDRIARTHSRLTISDNSCSASRNRSLTAESSTVKNRRKREKKIECSTIRPPAPISRSESLRRKSQKVSSRGRWREFSVLLASQPTRGVDVGAIEFIHQRLRTARAEGKAILLISAELKEVIALSDRVAVMYRGKMTRLMPVSEVTEESLGEYMMGTRKDSAA